jgi:hypothetical protein
MQVERGGFLLLVSSLAAGGAAGYLLSEKDLVPHLADSAHQPRRMTAVQVPAAPAKAFPTSQTELTSADLANACDDSIGQAADCPPIGLPTSEGGCGALAANRCADFKKTMKPRVAAAAVACLNKLKGQDLCDPKRIELCGHNALMNACQDSTVSAKQSCDLIAASCPGVSMKECSMAIGGLREIGREAMEDCTKAHCTDKGIVGCEAVAPMQRPTPTKTTSSGL